MKIPQCFLHGWRFKIEVIKILETSWNLKMRFPGLGNNLENGEKYKLRFKKVVSVCVCKIRKLILELVTFSKCVHSSITFLLCCCR